MNVFVPYFPFFTDFETLRSPGVLQRIGIVCFISSVLYLHFNWKILVTFAFSILILYWFFLGFVSFSDGSLPTFDRATNNWANAIDKYILGNHMWQKDYDPEGIISTIPAIATCLFGIFIGKVLDFMHNSKTLLFVSLGFLTLGYILHLWFPINKAIWSSSFVLVTGGWATLILFIIYFLRDEKNLKFGNIFKYIGMNAITIYFLSSFISKVFYLTKVNESHNIHSFLYDKIFVHSFFSSEFSSFLYAFSIVIFYSLLGYFLYRKKIFIKV